LEKPNAKVAANVQLSAVFQYQHLLTAKPRLHLPNAIKINDGRSMNSNELRRIQFRLQRIHGGAKHVAVLSRVQGDIVGSGFDPIDIGCLKK
jgi:hypothetical protein